MPYAVARVRRGPRMGLMYGAASSPDFGIAMVEAIRRGGEAPSGDGAIRFTPGAALDPDMDFDAADVRRLGGEQSNTSIAYGSRVILKLFRRLQPGTHPELEMGRFLTEVARFENTPALLGSVEHVADDGTATVLAVLQRYVRNQGDAWRLTLDILDRELDTLALVTGDAAPDVEESFATYLPYAEALGRRTAELHLALATPSGDPAFAVEPLEAADLTAAAEDARAQGERAFAALDRLAKEGDGAGGPLACLLARRDECLALLESLSRSTPPAGAVKTRVHGDYHLGQVLVAEGDVVIVDFEGEPSRPADERRAKSSPLRDVAGLLRSFAYAADTATRDVSARFPEARERIAAAAEAWRRLAERAFLASYEEAAKDSPVWIEDADGREAVLRLHLLAKALYEVNYEANNRPDWIETPVRGVLALLDEGAAA